MQATFSLSISSLANLESVQIYCFSRASKLTNRLSKYSHSSAGSLLKSFLPLQVHNHAAKKNHPLGILSL